ncbi:protein BLISTER isoform X2 [Diospyros lotus]|uniref:protein BLISTER isoform X2 n=1 Tax=Diospyros lotus TaxID=55363 RepID=UPI00224DF006|nr:protein BLISTER isoform X2 [Diospyros lotus]
MASAQVLPNSGASARKQGHLEAGKRRLEEFRKKKAADRAKKAASTSQNTANDLHEKQSLDIEHVRIADSSGAGTSDGMGESEATEFAQTSDICSSDAHASPPLPTDHYNSFSAETMQLSAVDKKINRYDELRSSGTVNVNHLPQPLEKNDDNSISARTFATHTYGLVSDQSDASHLQVSLEINGNSGQSNHYGLQEARSKDNGSLLKEFTISSPATSHVTVANLSSEYSGGIPLQNKFAYSSPLTSGLTSLYDDFNRPSTKMTGSSFEVGQNIHAIPESSNTMISDIGQRKYGNSLDHFPSGNSTSLWLPESQSASSFVSRSSSSHAPLYPAVAETNTRRSRPSFLDSMSVPRVPLTDLGRVESSASETSFTNPETSQPFSKLMALKEANAFEPSVTSSVFAGNGNDAYRHTFRENSVERKHDYYSQKQDEDFAALEQHIEDLTQEKFSLQRALEASRTLAESLAVENSSLTDSYNQQGSVVNQLKSDMEKLREEIKSQLAELESVKVECANAQLECNAADERAKLLASEVIGLEEKALRLRSSELKLERQLENSQAEVSSLKKKSSSLEKERQDLQSTISALQEEKKLLQAKIRKASGNGKVLDVSKSLTNKKDVSTSTQDLDSTDDVPNLEMHSDAPLLHSDVSISSMLTDNREFNLQVSSSDIPPDQMRMIQNINTLISELALEKEELMQALLDVSSESSKLKEWNNELSRKLEAQTQRLELLTAQSMATGNVPTRPPDSRSIHDNTPYADEGDEVVERVLGWIMKLFPGGPARRRTSKLL